MHSMKLHNISFIIHWVDTDTIFKSYDNSFFLCQNPFIIFWPYLSELVLPFITFAWTGYFPTSILENKQIKLLHTDSSGTYVLNWFLHFSDATLIVGITVVRVGFQNNQIVVVVNTPNIDVWLEIYRIHIGTNLSLFEDYMIHVHATCWPVFKEMNQTTFFVNEKQINHIFKSYCSHIGWRNSIKQESLFKLPAIILVGPMMLKSSIFPTNVEIDLAIIADCRNGTNILFTTNSTFFHILIILI